MLSSISLTQATVMVICVLLTWRYVCNKLVSPLRRIPGPFLASMTEYWLVLIDLAGLRTLTIHQLHKKYGPVVRVGPHEVSFADQESINEIYSQQTAFMKAKVYDTLSMKPLGIFSQRDKGLHRERRSLLSHAFSQGNVNACAPLVHGHISKLLRRVQDSAGIPLDILMLFRLFSLDVVGDLFLGSSFGGLEREEPPQYLTDIDQFFLLCGIEWNFPWIYIILSIWPSSGVKWFLASRSRIMEYGKNAYTTYIKSYGRKSGRKDLLTKILSPGESSPILTDRETYTEIGNLIFAGTDTTSTTLTYLFWELTRHPKWQQRIRDELQELNKAERTTEEPQFVKAAEAAVLEAVINESLRLHPAAPSSLLRATPMGGAQLSSYYIPEGTVVSAQCYTTQRNPRAFPNPDTFDPGRWLRIDEPSQDMKELFMPFSKGTRACLGRTLALMELRQVTSAILQRYNVSAARTTTPKSMEMRDHFLAVPKAGRCELVFEALY